MAYMESDPPAPLSVYGVSKFGGESLVRAASPRNIVVRTASLYGAAGSAGKGGNFVETMAARAKAGEATEVVDDVIMSPTYTRDLAAAIWDLLKDETGAEGGVYHIVNRGQASWFEFARKIFQLLGSKTPLKPTRSADRPSKIRRPPFSALASEKWPRLKVAPLRVWQEALKAYLIEKGHIKA
jgi:dTDP-4-dehydrorhamnose reductase